MSCFSYPQQQPRPAAGRISHCPRRRGCVRSLCIAKESARPTHPSGLPRPGRHARFGQGMWLNVGTCYTAGGLSESSFGRNIAEHDRLFRLDCRQTAEATAYSESATVSRGSLGVTQGLQKPEGSHPPRSGTERLAGSQERDRLDSGVKLGDSKCAPLLPARASADRPCQGCRRAPAGNGSACADDPAHGRSPRALLLA